MKSPKRLPYRVSFPATEYYHGFWTWDRVVGAFLIALIGAIGFNWFVAGSAVALAWNFGCIVFGGLAGVHLVLHFDGSYHIKFGTFLFCSALIGGLVLLGLVIYDILSHTAQG